MSGASNIVLVGPPRVGKTTVIQKVMTFFAGRCGGFYTQAAQKTYHTNFRVVCVDGRERTQTGSDLFHRLEVGLAYNQRLLEEVAVPAVHQAIVSRAVVLIDQIGTWELESVAFRQAVQAVLDSPRILLATATTSGHPFLEAFKSRPDVQVFTVSEANRSTLPDKVGRALLSRLGSASRAQSSVQFEGSLGDVDHSM